MRFFGIYRIFWDFWDFFEIYGIYLGFMGYFGVFFRKVYEIFWSDLPPRYYKMWVPAFVNQQEPMKQRGARII